jgi:hypothetical protein
MLGPHKAIEVGGTMDTLSAAGMCAGLKEELDAVFACGEYGPVPRPKSVLS